MVPQAATGVPHVPNARAELDARASLHCRVRRKSLYTGNSSDIGRPPDQVRHTIFHVLNEWAELAPDTTGTARARR
jgi:hypothetical protein